MTLLLALGVQIVFLLWPYYQYRFRFDPEDLLRLAAAWRHDQQRYSSKELSCRPIR